MSSAAYSPMRGRREALTALGLTAGSVAELDRIAVIAYRLLSPPETALDLGEAALEGARVTSAA